MYEVERRSYLKTDKEFNQYKSYLDKHARFLKKAEYETYLFRQPDYFRIRFKKYDDKAILTHKSGKYTDLARKETEIKIRRSDVKNLLKILKKLNFKNFAHIHSSSYSYKFKGLNISLTKYEYLGRIIEIEALTADKKQIPKLSKTIQKTLKLMNLKELKASIYQKMLDEMYKKAEIKNNYTL